MLSYTQFYVRQMVRYVVMSVHNRLSIRGVLLMISYKVRKIISMVLLAAVERC